MGHLKMGKKYRRQLMKKHFAYRLTMDKGVRIWCTLGYFEQVAENENLAHTSTLLLTVWFLVCILSIFPPKPSSYSSCKPLPSSRLPGSKQCSNYEK